MIGLQLIEETIKLTLFSAYLKDEEQPISLLLCANAEAGKTEELKKGMELDGIVVISDVTAFGILQTYGDAILRKKVRHILIPDLITPMSKRWETSASFISFLNLLVSEGIIEVRTFAFSKRFQEPVKCGIIGCITPKELKDRRHKWLGMGFMSRMMPCSWSYNADYQNEILNFIANREYLQEKLWSFRLPQNDIKVILEPSLARQLIPETREYTKKELREAEKLYGFRYQKHLQRFAMSSALADGRDYTRQADIDKVKELRKFLNLKAREIRGLDK